MTKLTRPTRRGLRHHLIVGGFAVLAAAFLSGCGAEPDQGVKSVPVEQATKVPVPGMSQQDYAKEMQQKAAGMGGGGGMGAPGGMPPGGMPGGAPGGMPPGGAPPGAPPGPPR